MQGTPFQKILLAMTLAAIVAALLLQFISPRLKPQPVAELPKVSGGAARQIYA